MSCLSQIQRESAWTLAGAGGGCSCYWTRMTRNGRSRPWTATGGGASVARSAEFAGWSVAGSDCYAGACDNCCSGCSCWPDADADDDLYDAPDGCYSGAGGDAVTVAVAPKRTPVAGDKPPVATTLPDYYYRMPRWTNCPDSEMDSGSLRRCHCCCCCCCCGCCRGHCSSASRKGLDWFLFVTTFEFCFMVVTIRHFALTLLYAEYSNRNRFGWNWPRRRIPCQECHRNCSQPPKHHCLNLIGTAKGISLVF